MNIEYLLYYVGQKYDRDCYVGSPKTVCKVLNYICKRCRRLSFVRLESTGRQEVP